MRSVKTFFIHLYTDTQTPERICGDLRTVDNETSYMFKNVYELVAYLRSWMTRSGSAISSKEGTDSPPLEDIETK